MTTDGTDLHIFNPDLIIYFTRSEMLDIPQRDDWKFL